MTRDDVTKTLRIASRASELALLQVSTVASRLRGALDQLGHGRPDLEIRTLRTIGDRNRADWAATARDLDSDSRSRKWTLEIEQAIGAGAVDMAIHSGKDLPYRIFPGTIYVPVLEREDPRDVFIPREAGAALADLPEGAVFGTNSNRRRANLRALRADYRFAEYAGNVPTRLDPAQMARRGVDGAVMAAAGLKRLRLYDDARMAPMPVEASMPAATQGIVAVQIREDAAPALTEGLRALRHAPTAFAWNAERAFLSAFDTGCETPIAVFAEIETDEAGALTGATLAARVPQAGGAATAAFESRIDLTGRDVDGQLARATEFGAELARTALAAGTRDAIATPADFPSVAAQ